jgi:uncharacterized protein YecE (DUF72 family)
MEFGRLPESELKKVDFSLPHEPVFNKKVLKGRPAKNPKVYLGCAKWGRPEWVGKIYPPKTREKNFLQHYVEHYNSIELNATHYKIYGPAGTAKWAEQAKGKDFLFCPKMYQGITHRGKLGGKKFITNEFLRGLTGFKDHLGPVFVQVNENFSPNRSQELFDFLQGLPTEFQFFLEVRHPGWFSDKSVFNQMIKTLASLKMGAVITDTAGRRDCAHMHLPISKAFIRYVGNSLHKSDFKRCDAWVFRIKEWMEQGLKELYFFMHMHDEATSPELTVYLVDRLNKECGLNLIKPRFIDNTFLQKVKTKKVK